MTPAATARGLQHVLRYDANALDSCNGIGSTCQAADVGNLRFIEGNMNRNQCLENLRENLKRAEHSTSTNENDPKHTTWIVKD